MSKQEAPEYKGRLREITAVLRKHGITRGVTPEKLRLILEDLGPTYIKLGQIMSMHSDILPNLCACGLRWRRCRLWKWRGFWKTLMEFHGM